MIECNTSQTGAEVAEDRGSLAGKVAVVTGAAQGIGRAYVFALARAGAHVIASSRAMGTMIPGEAPAEGSLAQTVAQARAEGLPVEGMICDVGDEGEIDRMAKEIVGNHGRIDVIINNAATYPGAHTDPNFDALKMTAGDWDLYMRVNVMGPYFVIARLSPFMIPYGAGSIVNVTSSAGSGSTFGSADHYGMMGYAVSKAALNRMTMFFAEEFRQYNIAVNVLDPGSVMTAAWRAVPQEMKDEYLRTGKSKLADEESMGAHIVHLASQTAAGLTGQMLKADLFGESWP